MMVEQDAELLEALHSISSNTNDHIGMGRQLE